MMSELSKDQLSNYIVIRHYILLDFIEVVNAYLAKGWKPIGGISTESQSGAYIQAMIKINGNS